jgi:hypothetical protein
MRSLSLVFIATLGAPGAHAAVAVAQAPLVNVPHVRLPEGQHHD